ncbi:hypothetical protein [Veronia pacifica]|uniref:hypothetical protein n=1 Tax=Veronia pacifica TaxID=1080227 RepID=UPI001112E932
MPELVVFLTKGEKEETTKFCELGIESCHFPLATVSLSVPIIKPLEEAELKVVLASSAPELMLELHGREMDMGVYRLKLQKQKAGQYTGTMFLPVCTQKEMSWEGHIVEESEDVRFPISIRMSR